MTGEMINVTQHVKIGVSMILSQYECIVVVNVQKYAKFLNMRIVYLNVTSLVLNDSIKKIMIIDMKKTAILKCKINDLIQMYQIHI